MEVAAGPEADRYRFIVERADFVRCCVAATVTRAGGSAEKPWFTVRRTVVQRRDYAVYSLTEGVAHDGRIIRREMKMLSDEGRRLGTFITPPSP